MNTYKSTDVLEALVEVKTDVEITAPYDFNLKVFVESPQDKSWHQTGNAVHFITPEYNEDHNLVIDFYKDDIRLQLLLTPESEMSAISTEIMNKDGQGFFLMTPPVEATRSPSNHYRYIPEDGLIHLNKDNREGFVSIYPAISDLQNPIYVFFCVSGYLVRNGKMTDEIYGASSSIILNPPK